MPYEPRKTAELLEEVESIADLARQEGATRTATQLDGFVVRFRKVDDSIEHAVTVLRSTLESKTAKRQIAEYEERERWLARART